MVRYGWVLGRLFAFALLLVLAVLAGSVGVPQAHAQDDDDRSVEVDRRDGEITIAENGDVTFVETWETRFIDGPFRFAFRSIPLDRVENITDWGVSENGQAYREGSGEEPNTFKLERDGDEQKITWYFPETSDATRTFTLRYTLRGALRIYPNGDQFYWKFIEEDRQYPIHASTVTVRLPQQMDQSQLRVANYRNEREQAEGAQIIDGQTVRFAGQGFSSGDEWEIRAQFPHGIVPATVPSWQPADDAARARDEALLARSPFFNLISLVAALVTLVGGGLGVYLLWYTRGRDKPVGAIAPYYIAPPENVPPGVVGTLLDESADMQDILATVVDLARRGYLQIVEKGERKGREQPDDFTFIRGNADLNGLRPFEQLLLSKIFGDTRRERRLSGLKNEFYKAIDPIQEAMYEEAVQHGYFAHNPEKIRSRYLTWTFVLTAMLFVVSCVTWIFVARYAPLSILVVFSVAIVGIAAFIVGFSMVRKTPAGATAAAKWQGFKRYLENLDRYTQVEQAQDQFERYLPYAIAFGLEKEWVRQFERVDAPMPTWYRPHGYDDRRHTYQPSYARSEHRSEQRSSGGSSGGSGGGNFGGDKPSLNTAASQGFGSLNAMSAGLFTMLNSATSTFTSQPPSQSSSSSGGFSGGGSSGGGGGGGGSSGFG